jgi:hypothetical protein
MRFAAEEQTNFIPRVLGPMMLRPGLQYKLGTKNNAVTWPVPFIFSHDDTAIIEFVGAAMRVLIDETPLTRTAVSTTVTSGDFSASAGWTLVAATGNTASISGGSLRLVASVRGTIVSASQAIPIALQDLNVEHALRIVVTTGPVKFRLGTSDGDDDIMSETLGQGEHSLAFTPTSGLIYVEFESRLTKDVYVDSIQIEAAGVVELTSPYDPADFPLLRHEQSGDVVYIACEDYQRTALSASLGTTTSR